MKSKLITCSSVLLAAGFLFTGSASAFDMGNMMNPSKWMKGDGNDDYDDYDRYDDYYDDRYRGRGYPPPRGYGYEGPGYGGYEGAPGFAPAYNAPQRGSSPDAAEISRLKERIRELEGANREIPPPSSYGEQQGYQQTPTYGGHPQYQQAPGYGGQPAYRQAPPSPAYGNPNPQYRPLSTN